MIRLSGRDKEYIEITAPSATHSGYGVQIMTSKKKQILPIVMGELMPKPWGAFYQGGMQDPEWIYFEFLGNFSPENLDELIEIVERIAKQFNLAVL